MCFVCTDTVLPRVRSRPGRDWAQVSGAAAGNGSCRGPRALARRLGQLQLHLDQTLRRNRTPAASPTLPTSAAGMTAGHAQRCGADLARPPALRRERTSRPPPPNLQTVHPAQGGRCLATATPGMRRQETGTGPPITSPEAPKPGGGLGSTCWNRCEIWRWASRTPAGDRTGKSATGMDVPPPSTAHLSGRGGCQEQRGRPGARGLLRGTVTMDRPHTNWPVPSYIISSALDYLPR